MVCNCMRDVQTSFQTRLFNAVEMSANSNPRLLAHLVETHFLHPLLLLLLFFKFQLLLLFSLLILFGVSRVLFFSATLHTQVAILGAGGTPEAAMRYSSHRPQPPSVAGAAASLITIDLKLYPASFLRTPLVSKVLPHFISEVEKCVLCVSFCPHPPNIKL